MNFKKRSVIILFTLIFSLTFCSAAFSANKDTEISFIEANKESRHKLTDKQKKCFDESNKKWKSLSNTQKEEIYLLNDKILDTKEQIINKYLELGIIDKKVAEKMKTKIDKYKSDIRKNDKMPMLGYKK